MCHFTTRNYACVKVPRTRLTARQRRREGDCLKNAKTPTFQIYDRGHRYQNHDHRHAKHREQRLRDGDLCGSERTKVTKAPPNKVEQEKHKHVPWFLRVIFHRFQSRITTPIDPRSRGTAKLCGAHGFLRLNIISSEVSKVAQ